jgi:ATP-dependent helicase HrpB
MLKLPIDEFVPQILKLVQNHSNVILSASPGAGKTTRLPPELLKVTDKKVLVLEPRRIAATAAANRIAEEQGWDLGNQVGYQIRFESEFNSKTRLLFLTEALLQKKMVDDPLLTDVGIVVIDEFHERSQHVDLAIGLLKELQELSRPDLKIIVMSATLNTKPLLNYFSDSTAIEVPGKIFPLEIKKSKTAQKLRTDFSFTEFICDQIKRSIDLVKPGEHILVFLPGAGEIERCFQNLQTWAEQKSILPYRLHGSLSIEEQRAVLKPSSQSKLILSTNVAESSLTIDGTRLVIDSGLQRRSNVHAKTGYAKLEIARISKSSATQRAGRAARQAPGICLQLWTEMDERSMPAHEPAEILRTDLSDSLLTLAAMDIRDFESFSWFEKPASDRLSKATQFLKNLGALKEDQTLTDLGRRISKIPAPPRIAKLLVISQEQNCLELGIDLAVLLTERDSARNGSPQSNEECDLCAQLESFRQRRSFQSDKARKSFAQVMRFQGQLANKDLSQSEIQKIKKLLFTVFKDQLAKRRNLTDRKALLIGGRGVELDAKSNIKNSEFFLALQLIEGLSSSDTKVSLASGLSKEELLSFEEVQSNLTEQEWLEYDPDLEKMLLKKAKSFSLPGVGSLALQAPHSTPAPAHLGSEQLAAVAFKEQDWLITKNEALSYWLERFHFYQKQLDLDLLSEELWKNFWTQACFGENSFQSILAKDLVYFIESQLDSETVKDFHQACPESIVVPSGSKMKIKYSGDNPSLEVRLQEVFGWKETPKIMSSSIPLTLVLLGPHYRPVQITQDLASFWQNGYPEVRKDLRLRYPKHSWPEDPWTAIAQAKGRSTKF